MRLGSFFRRRPSIASQPPKIAFDLERVLCAVLEETRSRAEARGIEFLTDFSKEPILLTGNASLIADVVRHLLNNALEQCVDGDAMRIWVRYREERSLIVVEDTGPGFAVDKIENAFDTSHLAPSAEATTIGAMSLARCAAIVDTFGGVIWAENIKPDETDDQTLGARIVIGLPAPMGAGCSEQLRSNLPDNQGRTEYSTQKTSMGDEA